MNITPNTLSTIIYTVVVLAAFAAEQFHLVPAGTTNVILALVTGHAVGSTVSTNASVNSSTTAPDMTKVIVNTPSQG